MNSLLLLECFDSKRDFLVERKVTRLIRQAQKTTDTENLIKKDLTNQHLAAQRKAEKKVETEYVDNIF